MALSTAGGYDAAPKVEINRIWKEAKFTTKDFKLPQGGYASKVKGKSGTWLDAKLSLTKFFPSNASVELGPYTR